MNSDDSDTVSSGSDDEVYEPTAEEVAEIMRLEGEVEANPNSYESHVAYVQLLSHCRLRERARAAREALAARFPLTEALWQSWIEDEAEAARTPEDVARIERLYCRAHEDLLSIDLLADHLEFVATYEPAVSARTPEGLTRFRSLAEDLLSRGGLHLAKGARLFQVLREFEANAPDGIQPSTDRIRQLFQRQLSLPLHGNDAALEDFKAFLASHRLGALPESTLQAVARANEMLEQRRSYEEAVAEGKPADTDLLAAYLAYIQLEEVAGDPLRACCLYERAVAAFPMTSELWSRYTRFVEVHVKAPSAIHATYKRALRHCPWAGALWAKALRARERWADKGETAEDTEREHVALYGQALMGGWLAEPEEYLEVMLARLDHLRRRGTAGAEELKETFGHATETMAQLFPEYVDRTLRLPAYWAQCEATVLGSVEGGRGVWEAALKGPLGKYSEGWLGYVDFERRFGGGNADKIRQVFKKAYSRRLEGGGQLAVCEAWLRWEREEGTAEDLAQAQLKVDPLMAEAKAAAAAALDAEMAERAKRAADKAPKLTREEMIRMRREKDPNYGKGKRKRGMAESDAQAAEAAAAAGGGGGATALGAAAKEEGDGAPEGKGAEGQDAKAPPAKKARTERPAVHTAFIVNLGFRTDEAALRDFFSHIGGVRDVRIVRDPKTQQSKGRAYVDFEAEEQLARAVAEGNGKTLEGRVLTVMVSKPSTAGGGEGSGKAHAPQQQAQGEGPPQQHQAYVKNLPDDTTEESLRSLFAPFGGIRAVRLVRDQGTGRLKGFAYLDLETAEALEAAVKGLNGKDLGGKAPLVVAHARNQQGPGHSREQGPFPVGFDPALGAGAGRGGSGGRGPRPLDSGPRHMGLGFGGGRGRGRGHHDASGAEGGSEPAEVGGGPVAAPAAPAAASMFRPRNVAVGGGRPGLGSKLPPPKFKDSAGAAHPGKESFESAAPESEGHGRDQQQGNAGGMMSNDEFRKFL